MLSKVSARVGRFALPFVVVSALAGCAGSAPSGETGGPTPAMRWDHVDQGALWTQETLAALRDHGSPLLEIVPGDIDTWCPQYRDADEEGRAQFWTALISALAKHESTWNEEAVGGGGLWFGLVQIAPATARGYDCEVGSGAALKDGVANLRCGVRIMAHTVPRDGVVSQGMRGVAADWGPFHSRAKRTDMIEWVRQQPYCKAPERRGLFSAIAG